MRIELNKGKLSDTVQCLTHTDRCNSKYTLLECGPVRMELRNYTKFNIFTLHLPFVSIL